MVQLDALPQLQAQRGQHQVPGDVVVVGQGGSREVAAQRDGVQQQLLQLFGHHGRLRLVQAHVHRVRNHVGGNQTLIVLQGPSPERKHADQRADLRRLRWDGCSYPDGGIGSVFQQTFDGAQTQVGRSDVERRPVVEITAGGVQHWGERGGGSDIPEERSRA